jgi:endonuclease/exonuclease/phosphatase family metal-dependent hydrolase
MIGIRTLALFTAATLLGASVVSAPSHDGETADKSIWPAPAGALSIMSYNIRGLPWPIAVGREEAISAIGQRLAAMRSSNAQPRVVLLQEAFGDAANAVGQAAGYRFVVAGPQVSRSHALQPLGQAFAKGAQWIKGEANGSLIDSGLAILSDYPVVRIERYAFPEGACAGYDCLAAKGVLVAWIGVPGAAEPIAIVDTHLNSRGAARVASQRADRAYAWQVAAIREFLSRALPSGSPVIFGGDFNTGQAPSRVAAVSQPLITGTQVDGLRTILTQGKVILGSQNEAQRIVARNKDKILFRDGVRVALRPQRAWVAFPLTSQQPLSDHAGFVIDFSIER